MMSVTGSNETYRTVVTADAPTGGATDDVKQLQATEDRTIVGVAIDDTGGSANVAGEISFSSTNSLAADRGDSTKASTVLMATQGVAVMNLNIPWHSGAELHLHTRNNSGAVEQIHLTVFYKEA